MSQSLPPVHSGPRRLQVQEQRPQTVDDWEVLGDTFEAMGKVGLALTVGFTAAAVFCRWAERRKLQAPSLKEVLHRLES